MAKKKATGAKATQKTNRAGKRLGVKIFGGQVVKPGQIIVRQRGKNFNSGEGSMLGKDFTVFSTKNGVVEFINVSKNKKEIRVV